MTFFAPAARLRGALTPPGDKSLSQRAAILAAMGTRPVRIGNFLRAGDTDATLRALAQLGAAVDPRPSELIITGCGLRGAGSDHTTLDLENSGTGLRLLAGWLAGQPGGRWTLTGDRSLQRRPVDRIVDPLARMGAQLAARDRRWPPLTIEGRHLSGISYRLPVASAQVKSALLLAGLLADGRTEIIEPIACRDHTERLLLAAGVALTRAQEAIALTGVAALNLPEIKIGGDPSAAAFQIAAALIIPGSEVRISKVLANWTRAGFVRVARRMGARIEAELEQVGAPPTATEPGCELEAFASSLHGTTVKAGEVGCLIDELPLVALLGCFAEGETVVSGAAELRYKESDRITALVTGLRALGAEIQATSDGFVVSGSGGLRGGKFDPQGDHRLAMLGAVAGLASREGVRVGGIDAAAISYPNFLRDLHRLSGRGASAQRAIGVA